MSGMTDAPPDRKVVQCNYAVPTKIAAQGARAYVVYPNAGNGHDRIGILVRSRGGRWVEKWEDSRRLRDFRVKTLPPEHPLYGNDRLFDAEWAGSLLAAMRGDAP
jgi:hypothetical protein